MKWNLTRSLICEFSKATRTPWYLDTKDLNLGSKTITVGRLRLARCVDSWSTALSRFPVDSIWKMVTIGPLLRKSLGSMHEVDGQLKFRLKILKACSSQHSEPSVKAKPLENLSMRDSLCILRLIQRCMGSGKTWSLGP